MNANYDSAYRLVVVLVKRDWPDDDIFALLAALPRPLVERRITGARVGRRARQGSAA
jgi:hypothetical protein